MKVKFYMAFFSCVFIFNSSFAVVPQYTVLPHGFELDKINSSIEKPGVSFEAIETTISDLEKNIDNLGQELKKLKNEVDDIKKIVNSGHSAPAPNSSPRP